MSFPRWVLLILSSILNLVFVIPYAHEVVRGKVRPNRVSWLLWLILGVASLLAVLKAGGRHEAAFNVFFVIGEGIVFGLALFKGETVFSKVDAVALIGGLISFLLLFLLDDPWWTLLAVIITDFFGFLPTWAKSWRDPASESLVTYIITFCACLCGYFAVADGARIYYLYPLYLMMGNGVLVGILIFRKRRLFIKDVG